MFHNYTQEELDEIEYVNSFRETYRDALVTGDKPNTIAAWMDSEEWFCPSNLPSNLSPISGEIECTQVR